jgi:hypothetical protein
MHDHDISAREAIEAELQAVTEEAARLHRKLDAIESDLARVVAMLLQATGRSDLALDFLSRLGTPSRTLH